MMPVNEPYPLIGEAAFVVGEATYLWDDVILAGLVWGDWLALGNGLRNGETALDRARAENALPTADDIEAAATRFRYEHNLISAQEARDWLARWKLGQVDWIEYIRRSIVRGRPPNGAAESREPLSAIPVVQGLHAEAVCSGMLERLRHEVAIRAACFSLDAASDAGDDPSRWTDDAILTAGCRLGLPPWRSRERLEFLATIDRYYSAYRASALTPAAVAREIDVHRMEWTAVACDRLSFDSEEAAREAILCIRADHEALRDVALAARRQVKRDVIYLDDESELAERLKGACVGEALGPFTSGGGFIVVEVQGRNAPASDDDEIRRRAESSIMRGLADRELVPMIRWSTAF